MPRFFFRIFQSGFAWAVNIGTLAVLLALPQAAHSGPGPQKGYTTLCTPADKARFEKLKAQLWPHRTEPMGSFVKRCAEALINTPYIHHPIESGPEEKLVAKLDAVDCVTFADNCLALARALKLRKGELADWQAELLRYRYRTGEAGKIEGYGSRYHYMGELLRDRQASGDLKIISQDLGGVPLKNQVNFMTRRPHKYPALASPTILAQVKASEARLNQNSIYFLPKKSLPKAQKGIQDGDVIGFTSSLNGLDITHMGIAAWRGDQLFVIHASRDFKRVMYSTKPLVAYMANKKQMGGVVVARMLP